MRRVVLGVLVVEEEVVVVVWKEAKEEQEEDEVKGESVTVGGDGIGTW